MNGKGIRNSEAEVSIEAALYTNKSIRVAKFKEFDGGSIPLVRTLLGAFQSSDVLEELDLSYIGAFN